MNDLRIAAKTRDVMSLDGSGVAGAVEYRVYRHTELFSDPAVPGVEFIAATTSTGVQLTLKDSDVIAVIAVDGDGLITVHDARYRTLKCDRTRCAP